ncbi:hypothetical protein [Actinomadura sp. B10D3]|uniref:hypothetical protein n=1 Tax=Actinomadura sp. B10D3 TaxID=3153557 RepID=UPI00325CD1C6
MLLKPRYTVGGQVIRPASVIVGEPDDLTSQAQQAMELMAASHGASNPINPVGGPNGGRHLSARHGPGRSAL